MSLLKINSTEIMIKKAIDYLTYILALFIPFYFVFYGPLYEKPESVESKTIWKFIITGLVLYIIMAIAYFNFYK